MDNKKACLLAVILALVLLFALAACSGNNADTLPDSGTTSPDTAQTSQDTLSHSAAPNPLQTPDVPDNGTPPEMPQPFMTHTGDKGYFYTVTDDYLVVMYDPALDSGGTDFAAYSGVVAYHLVCFENNRESDIKLKYVFATKEDAESYISDKYGYEVVGNVAYPLGQQAAYMDPSKESIVESVYRHYVNDLGGQAHLSKTKGFEDLMQNSSGGETTNMVNLTLRDAYADAGMNIPVEADFIDFDMTNYVLTIRPKEDGKQVSEVFGFDGENMIFTCMLTHYDDPTAAGAYDQEAVGNVEYYIIETEMPDERHSIVDQAADWRSFGHKVYIGNY